MSRFAEGTTVSVEKSRAEIETILNRYGATSFASMISADRAMIVFEAKGRRIAFDLPLPNRAEKRFAHDKRGRQFDQARIYQNWEQACRQRWRALALVIKAKLEAVETGITTFEDEFLAHIMMPDGLTVAQHVRPRIAKAYETQTMQPLLPPPPGATNVGTD